MNIADIVLAYQRIRRAEAPRLCRQFRGTRSYAKAASELGCSRSYLWKIEHGTEIINDDLLLTLVRKMENG